MTFESMRRMRLAALAAAVVAAACGETEAEFFDEELDDMDQFAASGKTDTGYVSDQAAELNAEFTGKVVIDLSSRSSSEKSDLLAKARAGDKAAFALYPTEQIKFARNVLKAQKFNANLESAPATISSVSVTGGNTKIEVAYSVTVESLVKNKDLPAGTTIADLIGTEVRLVLPADPKVAFAKGGIGCATDPDDPSASDASVASEISEYNYFFYWNPEKRGCSLEKSPSTFRVKNEAASKVAYPEFDKLLADKKISLVMLFGQLEHGELLDGTNADGAWDWGWIGYDDMQGWLRANGFTKTSQVPARAALNKTSSSKWKKTYSAGMTVEVDLVSPLDLQDHADAARKDQILKDAIRNHEIVYYNGHSFYGSLKVLDDPANFPSYYQLVFMDSCWSYAYYTKQVFTSKKTSSDPTGMVLSDVINNTEPGISGSHETFGVFLKKLFIAANYVSKNQKSKAKNYTWKNLIKYMNTDAKRRSEASKRTESPHEPEIYGASGVTANKWKP